MPPTAKEFTLSVGGCPIHSWRSGPSDGPTVLLLHGAAFSAQTWIDLGTLQLLADAGFQAIAIDLPGHAKSAPWPGKEEGFLAAYMEALELPQVSFVSPSMSGRYSLPFLALHPEKVTAFVALAPVAIPQFLQHPPQADVPLLAIWGSNDSVVSLTLGKQLVAAMPHSELVVLEGAPHPSYIQQPQAFHQHLLEFLQSSVQ